MAKKLKSVVVSNEVAQNVVETTTQTGDIQGPPAPPKGWDSVDTDTTFDDKPEASDKPETDNDDDLFCTAKERNENDFTPLEKRIVEKIRFAHSKGGKFSYESLVKSLSKVEPVNIATCRVALCNVYKKAKLLGIQLPDRKSVLADGRKLS